MGGVLHTRRNDRFVCASLVALCGLALLFVHCSFFTKDAEGKQRSAQALKNEARRSYLGIGVDQDFTRALTLYEIAAKRGDVEAGYMAGGMYYTGKGALKDPFKAFKYLSYAASQGESTPDSQRALAQFFLLGEVVPQNYQKALQWYEQAAAGGDSHSQVELGYLYFVGKGVDQDFRKALDWFQEAARQNNTMAQYNLGIMWYTGNGVSESSLDRAYAWFSIAAVNKFADAVLARDYLESILPEEERDSAQKEAARLYTELQEQAAATRNSR